MEKQQSSAEDSDRPRAFKLRGGRGLLVAAWIQIAVSVGTTCLQAQLVLENPRQKWRPGATVELVLRSRDLQKTIQIDEVLFDDRSIPFEVVEIGVETDALNLRIQVPSDIGRGAHRVVVVSADARVGVPEILGLTLAEARRRLEEAGFGLDAGAFGAAPAAAVHTVAQQDPAAGTKARPGTQIAVGIETEVPEVLGLTVAEALLELEERGLELAGSEAPPGAVIWEQDPQAGTRASPETPVSVEMALVTPNLVGLTADQVRATLLEAGFVPQVVLREAADGPFETVVAQVPAAGLLIPPASSIAVTIESLPDPPPPRWPWPWMVATVALAAGLGVRVKARRAFRRSFRVEAHNDLDHLLESVTAPAWSGRKLGLDIRLLGCPDSGRQTLVLDGPLVIEPG